MLLESELLPKVCKQKAPKNNLKNSKLRNQITSFESLTEFLYLIVPVKNHVLLVAGVILKALSTKNETFEKYNIPNLYTNTSIGLVCHICYYGMLTFAILHVFVSKL